MSAAGLIVAALLALAPGAFAATLDNSSGVMTVTGDQSSQQYWTFTDSAGAGTVDAYFQQDPVTYTAGGNPAPNCIDADGGNNDPSSPDFVTPDTDGTAYVVECTGVNSVVATAGNSGSVIDASGGCCNSNGNTPHHLAFTPITLNGGAGADGLSGGDKDDVINGGDGVDFLAGSPGNDTVNGGAGNDGHIVGGPGNDTISGGDGSDTDIEGGPGNDTIDGGAGDDEIYGDCDSSCNNGGNGNDTIQGGDGNDYVQGDGGNDNLDGGAGDDEVVGDCSSYPYSTPPTCGPNSDGDDTLNGGAGNDQLIPSGGSDSTNGGDGDDYIYEQDDAAPDTDHGGAGNDTVEYFTNHGTSSDDSASFTLDDQANDGYRDLTGTASPDDSTNNIGSDVEGVYSDLGDTPTTVVGSDSANDLETDSGADTVTPGNGSDIVFTYGGPDTINAADGYPDWVDCGDGDDTATVDQFDTVLHCEHVTTQQTPSAYQVPEDQPPSVSFATPSNGKSIPTNKATTLVANASDDHGISKVVFSVGTRVVCTDTTAPYTCDYTPIGSDLGHDTLIAVAYDTAGQTALAVDSVTVPRFVPTSLSAKTTPKKDTTLPYRFTTSGKVNVAPNVGPGACTGGHVSVQFRAGKKTISNRRVATAANCTYRSTVTFRIPSRLHPKTLTVLVRFLGSSELGPRSHKRYSVKVA
jgi:Ca2+-binding RTX toxin-like protein